MANKPRTIYIVMQAGNISAGFTVRDKCQKWLQENLSVHGRLITKVHAIPDGQTVNPNMAGHRPIRDVTNEFF